LPKKLMTEPLGLESQVVRLVPHDRRWNDFYRREAERLASAIAAAGLPALRIEHVGSTSVPGLAAKPVLDIAAGRIDTVAAAEYVAVVEGAGYVYRGECGLPGREFFRRGEVRTHHLHLVELNGEHWQRYLCFRDALRTDDVARDAYEALKRELAQLYPRDREAYVEGKREFVEDVIGRSIESASVGSERIR
jgi:GrpB-like predicted nucleotidyltransferase (UPF0157 family)